MAEHNVPVTVGAGINLHGTDRTISSTTVVEQHVHPAEYAYPGYTALISAISIATSSDHVLQLMAGSSLNVRVRRIHIEQNANATAASIARFQVVRLTSAGTGGTSVTTGKLDNADATSGATAMTLPTAKGTEGTPSLTNGVLTERQAFGTTTAQVDDTFEWSQHPFSKSILIPAGTSNGIAIKIITGQAGATVDGWVEFVETSFI